MDTDPIPGHESQTTGGKSPLERLRAAFAEMLGTNGRVPHGTEGEPEPSKCQQTTTNPSSQQPLNPRSILEAMLFVGHPVNEPLSNRQVASLIRGVTPEEVDGLVRQLNGIYDEYKTPYTIISEGAGYRLVLRDAYDRIRHKFHGRIREARLSRGAIEVLSIVAYNQPVSADVVNQLRGAPSGGFLTQLVRRQILKMERPAAEPRRPLYSTTPRFLRIFGLSSLDELPQSAQLETH
ncbi:MAG: SMC-Scp complex subunit ScpB [Pirellulales bacterium]|nr:SMC-Scp complex subunit ScpB [Pirellulales bacterium]